MESIFAFQKGDVIIAATIIPCENGHGIIFHHNQTKSLSDLVIKPNESGKMCVTAQGGRKLKSRQEITRYWPTGWHCFKSLVRTIEALLELREPHFSQAISSLTP